MIVTIHQPEHLPWTGFFHKMMSADFYVYLDHVQYRKNYFQNRNKIVNKNGNEVWATIPIWSGSINEQIMEKQIIKGYSTKYISLIESSYKYSKYFDNYFDKLKSILMIEYKYLIDLNLDIINFFRDELDISSPTIRSSEMNIKSSKSELILDICKKIGADSYLAGPSGLDYLDINSFKKNNIEILIHNYSAPVYKSNHFYPNLSTLDLLFNHGENSRKIILDSGNIKIHN
ncbi:WbqC family protein [Candidatus Pseudothioglobus singularis]|nr:WbqC family protein [Candidatus Pseudothioglobus singularis]